MKLIIINGPSGVGKSTVSTKLREDIQGSVIVDIDELRRSVPDYRERRQESLALAYQTAADTIQQHLSLGQTVIVDKTISDSKILDQFIEIGKAAGAEIHEFLLFVDKETLQRRADMRGYREGGLLTPEKVGELWEKINALKNQRPEAVIVDVRNLDQEQLLVKLKKILEGEK